jgi:hypothetical protein
MDRGRATDDQGLMAGEASADNAEAEIEAGQFVDDFTDGASRRGTLSPHAGSAPQGGSV